MYIRALVTSLVIFPSLALGSMPVFEPRLEYRFDDSGSGKATDSSMNHNDGAFVGDARFQGSGTTPALPGNVDVLALGGNGTVSTPSSASLLLSSDFTVSTWVRLDATGSENTVLSKDNPTSGYTNFNLHVFAAHAVFAMSFTDGESAGGSQLATPGAVTHGSSFCDSGGCAAVTSDAFVDGAHPLGTWRIVTASYTAATHTMRVYIDCNAPVVAAFTTIARTFTDSSTLQVGARKANSGSHVQGGIDEARIYGRVLSDDEVKALAAEGGLCASPFDMAVPADLTPPPDLARPDLTPPVDQTPLPDLARPDLSMPDLSTDLAMPDLAMPDLAMPDLAMPDLATPDLATPDLAMPDLATPAPLDDIRIFFDDAFGHEPDLTRAPDASTLISGGAAPSGCGCTVAARPPSNPMPALALVALLALAALRRRRR